MSEISLYNNEKETLYSSLEIKSLIKYLVNLEKEKLYNSKFREEVTGKLVDRLFKDNEPLKKELKNGIVFNFLHQNKITRDFILSSEEKPDHVWEPMTTKLLLDLSKDAKQIIVGGAYIGDHAIIISKENSNSICHTFEPNKLSVQFLEKNINENNLSNIIINRLALWDEFGKTVVLEGDDVLGSSVESADSDPRGITTMTIDEYAILHKIDKIDLIMLDIEGGEMKALEGAKNTLEKDAPTVVFESHSIHNDWSHGISNSAIMKFMEHFGYSLFSIRDFHSNVDTDGLKIELIPISKTYTEGPHHGFNVLAIKNTNKLSSDKYRFVEHLSPKLFIDRKDPLFQPSEWI
jgi:FkbM family methyltransferase